MLALATFLLTLEDTAVAVGLPSIGRDLGFGVSGLEWVVNVYSLAIAAFVLAGGTLADRVGRGRMFLMGLGIFTLASLAAGASGSGVELIVARSVQGIGAALMGPAALAIIATSFPRSQRGAVLGIWAGVSSAALALGPLTGAALTQQLGWSWIFWVNVPLGVAAWIVGARVLDVEAPSQAGVGRIDGAGLLLGAGAIVFGVFSLTEAASYGWRSPLIVAAEAFAAFLLAAFVVRERRCAHAMIDLSLFADRSFAGANVVTLLSTAVMCSIFFFVSLYLQMVRGYSPIETGLAFLPMTLLIVAGAPLAGRLSDRVGPRLPVTSGLLILAAGLGALSQLGTETSSLLTLSGLAVVGVGVSLITTPATAAALDGASDEAQAMAAGILNTFRVVGLAVGIAAMGAIVALHWPAGFAASSGRFDMFVSGLSLAFTINTVIAAATALIAFLTLTATASREDYRGMTTSPTGGAQAHKDPDPRRVRVHPLIDPRALADDTANPPG